MGFFDAFKKKEYWEEGYDAEYNYYTCYEGWQVLDQYGDEILDWETKSGLDDRDDELIVAYHGETISLELVERMNGLVGGWTWRCSFKSQEYYADEDWPGPWSKKPFYFCTEALRDFVFDNAPDECIPEIEAAFETVPENPRVLSNSVLVNGESMDRFPTRPVFI